VNLGAENRNKTMLAIGLAVLALGMVVYRVMYPTGSAPATAGAAAPPAPTPGTIPARAAAKRVIVSSQRRSARPASSLDPTLQLGLLRSAEETTYTGSGRNIFRAAPVVIPHVVKSPVKVQAQIPTGPPPPPPPPPINLKFFGFASKPGEPKKVFLSTGEDVFIAAEGDIVNRRYKILHIGTSSIEVEDVLNNNRQSIPLTQG
jgi:hypothetical protein